VVKLPYIHLANKNTDFEVMRVEYPEAKLKKKSKKASHASTAKARIAAKKSVEDELPNSG